MFLKRHYAHDAPRDDWDDREGTTVPPLSHVEVLHTGWTPSQHFSTWLIAAGVREGWITIEPGEIILHTKPETLRYQVLRVPGRYCCHCGEKLTDDMSGELARLHLAMSHLGEPSPDPHNPSGYCMLNYYECVLSAALHARWSIIRDADGHLRRGGVPFKGGHAVG